MSGTTIYEFVTKLQDQLVERLEGTSDFGQVKVWLVPDQDDTLHDVILLTRDTGDDEQVYTTTRSKRDETVTWPGMIVTYDVAPGEEAFKNALARAVALLGELIAELRDNPPQVGLQTTYARLERVRWIPSMHEQGGWVVQAAFDVYWEARVF